MQCPTPSPKLQHRSFFPARANDAPTAGKATVFGTTLEKELVPVVLSLAQAHKKWEFTCHAMDQKKNCATQFAYRTCRAVLAKKNESRNGLHWQGAAIILTLTSPSSSRTRINIHVQDAAIGVLQKKSFFLAS